MSETPLSLTPPLVESSQRCGLYPRVRFFVDRLSLASAEGDPEFLKSFLEVIFAHLRKDPAIISEYLSILDCLCNCSPAAERALAKSISKKGRCPRESQAAVRDLLQRRRQAEAPKRPTPLPSNDSGDLASQQVEPLSSTLDRLFATAPHSALRNPASAEFKAALSRLRRDVEHCEDDATQSVAVPQTVEEFVSSARTHSNLPDSALSQHFLRLARACATARRSDLFFLSMAEHSFYAARPLSNNRKARPFLQALFWFYSRIPAESQRDLAFILYQGVTQYFTTYTLNIAREPSYGDHDDRFYAGFLRMVGSLKNRDQIAAFGQCVATIAVSYPFFFLDLINRIKTRGEDHIVLSPVCGALCDDSVFKSAPYECILLLSKLRVSSISDALSRQSYSSAEDRRTIAAALLTFFYDVQQAEPIAILRPFASRAGSDTRKDLTYALLVEPLPQSLSQLGSERKAEIVTAAFAVFSDPEVSEYFKARMAEVGQLFSRQSQTNDPNLKGSLGYTILDNIRRSRKWLVDRTRGDLKSEIIQFLRTVEGHVTTEQAKLIRDTTLELGLVSARTPYSTSGTRITIELRNAGHGSADSLELEVLPVAATYEVDERHRVLLIDSLADQVPVQRDLWIRPLVAANSSIDISVELRYNTLKERGKSATLPEGKRTVWLYPETQYVRVAQPYSIGEPATTWFYGREGLLDNMADNLRHGRGNDQSMIVYGLKRAGKTSILKRFLDYSIPTRGLSENYIPIYVDLLREPRVEQLKHRSLLSLLAWLICEGIKGSLPDTHLASNLSTLDKDFAANPAETFSVTLDEVTASLPHRRILLALDEFSTLNEWLSAVPDSGSVASAAFGFLSNTLQTNNQLTIIFTGTYMLLEMMRERAFDLAKTCIPYMVGFLDEYSARQLVEAPVRRDVNDPGRGWLEYDPRAVDRIVHLTNKHPYLVQYMCMQIVNRMNSLKHNSVNLNDVESVAGEIVQRPMHAPVMLTLWNEFSRRQHAVLSIIASASEVVERGCDLCEIVRIASENVPGMGEDDVASVCASLADAEMLERISGAEADLYRLTIPLYYAWLRQNKPISALASAH